MSDDPLEHLVVAQAHPGRELIDERLVAGLLFDALLATAAVAVAYSAFVYLCRAVYHSGAIDTCVVPPAYPAQIDLLVPVRSASAVEAAVVVGEAVAVLVGVLVDVAVAVLVAVRVGVLVGVDVGVFVGVNVAVRVAVAVAVGVGVLEGSGHRRDRVPVKTPPP